MKSALIGIVGVLASFGVMYAICMRAGVNASPAILAAALAVGLARRPEKLHRRSLVSGLLVLPLVALAAGLVGVTFRLMLPLGAVLFCLGIAFSIWLRNFGERGAAVGRTIALPFMAMLIVPVRVETSGGPAGAALLVIAAGAIAFACSAAAQWIARWGVVEATSA